VYPLAVALEALQPAVTNIEGRSEAEVEVVLKHCLLHRIDLNDMVGSAERKRWFRFMDIRLMAAFDDAGACLSIVRSHLAFEKLDFLRETDEKS
jgi:uncharacterized ferredoxin-like protein